ncbi:cytochrome c3 family protein [Brumimicrobium salinarum]|nr:cytochrome c3 family protein [Brumimicrobium salinarum]
MGNKGLFTFLVTLFMLTAFASNAQEGESIFNSKCATCHAPHKDMTGPKLFEVRQKWEEGGAMEGSLYQWVKNWQVAAATDPYAKEVADWAPSAMTTFADLSNEQIDAIFNYVDEQPLPGAGGGESAAGGEMVASTNTQENDLGWIWYILGAVFLVVIFSVGGVKRQLQELDEDAGKEIKVGSKAWMFKNRKYIGMVGLVVVMAGVTWLLVGLNQVGVVTGYQPSQPIAFPHDKHAGINGIDCKYCHNSANKSKSAGIPTTNVCMNCHKQIQGEGDQVEKIKKIYKSAGFSPEGGGKYSGETENIVWNKVHQLPDHVYFNHSQHVEVGGIDCKQCHGDMTKQKELPRVVPVEELNKIEGNIQLTKATLTMGWCIECHGVKEVSSGPIEGKGGYYDEIHKRLLENDETLYEEYLEDGKVTVDELGGWECAKCHY